MNDIKAYIKSQDHFEEHRDYILNKMVWSTPKRGGTRNDTTKDITISTVSAKQAKNGKALNIIYRHDVNKLIDTEGLGRVGICCAENRLFFKAMPDGYAFYNSGKTVGSKIFYDEAYAPFVGDHDLKYDDFLKLYYIEK